MDMRTSQLYVLVGDGCEKPSIDSPNWRYNHPPTIHTTGLFRNAV